MKSPESNKPKSKEIKGVGFLMKWYRKLTVVNRILLAIVATIVAVLGVIELYNKLFYDKQENVKTKEEVQVTLIDKYQKNPHFSVGYYSFDNKEYAKSAAIGKDEYELGLQFIENEIWNEYLNTSVAFEHMDVDNISLFGIGIKNIGTVPAQSTVLLTRVYELSQGFTNTTSNHLNTLQKDGFSGSEVLKSYFKNINLGDLIDKEIFLPTMMIFHNYSEEDGKPLTDSATNKLLIIPVKLYHTNPVTKQQDSIDIRPMLDYKIKYNVYVTGKG